MIALLIGVTALTFMALLGWYGYRAYLRIQTWGRNMNEIDGICLEEVLPGAGLRSYSERRRDAVNIPLVASFKTPHRHA